MCGAGGNQLQGTGDRSLIVDPFATDIVFRKEHGLVAGNRQGDGTVGECRGRDPRLVEARKIMPVPRQALAAAPFLAAEDVDGGRLLSERPLSQHDGRMRLGKRQFENPGRRVAHDGPARVRLAYRSSAEFDYDFRANETAFLDERLVTYVEPVRIRSDSCDESGTGEPFFDYRASLGRPPAPSMYPMG